MRGKLLYHIKVFRANGKGADSGPVADRQKLCRCHGEVQLPDRFFDRDFP